MSKAVTLGEILWKVEFPDAGIFPFKCFLDAYKGVSHIQMAEGGEVNTKGIKLCTDKVEQVLSLQSQNAEKEAEAAFRQMKEHIAKLPMLTAPEEQRNSSYYLGSIRTAVSVVLMSKRRVANAI
ncbi:hypothetical protein Tco_1564432 [Tanacetum coccineum]